MAGATGFEPVIFSVTPHKAGRTGFEPVIFSVTGRRVRPGYTNDPLYAGQAGMIFLCYETCPPRSD